MIVALHKKQKMFLHNVLINGYWFSVLQPKFRAKIRDIYQAGNYSDSDRTFLNQLREIYIQTVISNSTPKASVTLDAFQMWVDETTVSINDTRTW